MPKKTPQMATYAFALFCFVLALYLSLGGYLQFRFGRWGIVFNQVVILLLPALIFVWARRLKWKEYYPFHLPSWREFLLTILLTALVIAPIEVLIYYQNQFLPLPSSIEEFYQNLMARPSWWVGVVQLITLAVVPSVCEEFFFRGFMQEMLSHRFGQWKSIALTAFFFALAHMNPWYMLYYFLLGLYLGWLRNWRGNLFLCILAHLMNNLYSLYGG